MSIYFPKRLSVLALLWWTLVLSCPAQTPRLFSLQPADSLHRGRFYLALGAGSVAYGATMAGLNHSWYADYPRGRFHVFNDLNEWMQMDKMGHWLMAYNESRWICGGARWIGLSPWTAAWLGFAGSQLIQTSFELLDGFSSQGAFSWGSNWGGASNASL
ncbi:MAG: hypothetical protein EP344_18245 [Bacteroidetes bacterium]|nr:MAG: hypothetical protein EP344_18245 [Bacteroidota bacterium]